jgi:hypothetical protein
MGCNCKQKKPVVQNRQPEYVDPFDNIDEFFVTPLNQQTVEMFHKEQLDEWGKNMNNPNFNNGTPVPYQSMKDNKDFNI